jgi:hypothetical protein
MKPTIKTVVLSASVLAIGMGAFGTTTTAWADNAVMSEYVKDVDLQLPGMSAVVNVKNISGNKLASKVKLQAMENALGFEIDGTVQCAQDSDVDFSNAKVYFGPVTNNNGTISDATALDSESASVSFKTWGTTGFAKKGWLTESAGGTQLYEAKLSDVKNGHPALRVDPIAEIEKAADAFVNNGGTLADFYKHDRNIVLQRPISLAGWCQKNGQKKGGFETKNHTVTIKYQGDPAVYQVALNAQLANNNMPNQVQQNPDLPFQLNDVEFQPNMPNYIGKCLPDQNPKIRVNFNVAGGKQGLIDLRIKEEGNQYADYGNFFETSGIAKNPQNGGSLDFSFPLKEMLSQDKYAFMMQLNNKTYSHNMVIEARFKNFDGSNEWSQWKEYDNAVFKHRCTPQLSPNLGGNNGGIGGYDNGGQGNAKPTFDKVQPANPGPKPLDKIKAAPVEAKPARATRN